MKADSSSKSPKVYVIGGLLYGDEGKGTTVEYITKETNSKLVVRYNGGPQAAHHIVTPDGEFHCFSQFASATFIPDTHTLLSKYMVVYPQTMLREAKKLIERHNIADLLKRTHIDHECFIITPYHQLINRITEVLRGSKKHGSTGLGVGVCTDEAFSSHPEFFPYGDIFSKLDKQNKYRATTLQVQDLAEVKVLAAKLKKIISEKLEQAKTLIKNFNTNTHFISEYLDIFKNEKTSEQLEKNSNQINIEKSAILQEATSLLNQVSEEHTIQSLSTFYKKFHADYSQTFLDGNQFIKEEIEKGNNVVFEGAQGALLDRVYGIFPHLTKSICSDTNAMAILNDVREKLKFIESPFENFEIAKIGVLRAYSSRHGSGPFVSLNKSWIEFLKEQHNMYGKWQGEFKVGPFDLVAAKYGIQIFQPDFISLTCIDKLANAGDVNEDFKEFEICENYLFNVSSESQLLPLTSEQRKILNKKDLFVTEDFSQVRDVIRIKEIKKRKLEDAYCNLDLLKILKDVEPELKKLSQYEMEINGENENMFVEIMVENKEKIRNKINYERCFGGVSKFLSVIEEKLKVPIGVLSFGPTLNDKICVPNRIGFLNN